MTGILVPRDGNVDGYYDYNLDCWWILIARELQTIQLNIQYIDIEEDTDCQSDRLEVS